MTGMGADCCTARAKPTEKPPSAPEHEDASTSCSTPPVSRRPSAGAEGAEGSRNEASERAEGCSRNEVTPEAALFGKNYRPVKTDAI